MVDFQQLAALFAKRYAFLEWKRDAISFDGLKLAPWVERVKASKSDLEFFEICSEYVAAYGDGHTGFVLPSTFQASLGFSADLYNDTVLIDKIDRKKLPEIKFPAQTGDELVSIDARTPAAMMADSMRFIGEGNPRSARRIAAALLTVRDQHYGPRSYQLGDSAEVVVRRQGGGVETYTVPWTKQGLAYTTAGPVPDPSMHATEAPGLFSAAAESEPAYKRRLRALQTFRARRRFYLGVDQLKPLFTIDGFTQRLGNDRYDVLYSGTFQAGGHTFGFLRVPDFEYIDTVDLEQELAYFESKTDGLIVDVMSNPGGYGCAAEDLLAHLMPGGYHSVGNSIRATWDAIMNTQLDLDMARFFDASDEDIAALESLLFQLQRAYGESRGFTTPQPLCGNSLDVGAAVDKKGRNLAYTKPILVLTDELSASAAEIFAAVMQDEKRGFIYGLRTGGAGGAVDYATAGFYSEAGSSLAATILVRKKPIASPQYPAAPYIENIGVLPDKTADIMTRENLLNQGKAFVRGFSDAMVEHVNSQGANQ